MRFPCRWGMSAALQAADLNGDGQVTITDMIRLQAYLLGRGTIQPN